MFKNRLTIMALILFMATIAFSSPMTTQGQSNPDIDPTYPDVFYVEDGDFKQRLDIYLPENAEPPYPTILLFHGNGYNKWDMKPLVAHFLSKGYAALAIEYRNPYPDYPQDVFCSLAWTHTFSEEYGFDTEHIVALGHSMGGFGATILGVTDDTQAFMGNCSHNLPEENRIQGIILYAAGGIDSAYPLLADEDRLHIETVIDSQIDGNDPPFLILHGTIDTLVRAESSEHFAILLDNAEVENMLVLLDEVGHFFINPESEGGAEAIGYVDEFLEDLFEVTEDPESIESDTNNAE